MAISLRGLCRLNINNACNLLFKPYFLNAGIRTLYSERDLGVIAYENARFAYRNQFVSVESAFRDKMLEACEDESSAIYTEDLKAMVHLVQETDRDMNLVYKMIDKYIKGKEEDSIGSYAFGPVVMRMCYFLRQPKQALTIFENFGHTPFFLYQSSFRILLTLLYNHHMYKEMKDVYSKIVEIKGIDYAKSNSNLIYAACLKENTPEMYEYALDIWKQISKISKPLRRGTAMLALLAIKNKAPNVALEVMSLIDGDRSMVIRCLRIMAYLEMERYLNIIPLLKRTEDINGHFHEPAFFAETIYEVEERLKTQDTPEVAELLRNIDHIKQNQQLEVHCTLEEYLLRPISMLTKGTTDDDTEQRLPRGNSQRYRKRYFSGVKAAM